jgi:hypothetical protein
VAIFRVESDQSEWRVHKFQIPLLYIIVDEIRWDVGGREEGGEEGREVREEDASHWTSCRSLDNVDDDTGPSRESIGQGVSPKRDGDQKIGKGNDERDQELQRRAR